MKIRDAIKLASLRFPRFAEMRLLAPRPGIRK